MNDEEIITRLKAIDMWYDVGEKYSLNDLNAIEGILKLYKKQTNIIKNAIDYIQHNNKELKNYSEQEMLDWLYGLDKCCEIKEEN